MAGGAAKMAGGAAKWKGSFQMEGERPMEAGPSKMAGGGLRMAAKHCRTPGCGWVTEETDPNEALRQMTAHNRQQHPGKGRGGDPPYSSILRRKRR